MVFNKLFGKKFKLNFIIVGAQKAGTTALFHYLNQHNNIALPEMKELHFFDNDLFYNSYAINYNWIEKQFKRNISRKIYGEATPIYMYWEPCLNRIKDYNTEIKLIAILRNPITRAYSQWNHECKLKNESRNFKQCILEEKNMLDKDKFYQHRVNSYIGRGLYSKQIKKMKKIFPENQMMFIKYEEFYSSQESTVNNVLKFIGTPAPLKNFNSDFSSNYKPYSKQINSEETDILAEIFNLDIIETELLLNWDCSDWKVN